MSQKNTLDANVAHASLIGQNLRTASGESGGCTALHGLTVHHAWDFGLPASLKGIVSDVELERVVIADVKHHGVHIMRRASMTSKVAAKMLRSAIVGSSAPTRECHKCFSG